MIKRKTVAAILSTTAFAFSIALPAQAGCSKLLPALVATDAAADRELQRRTASALAAERVLAGALIAVVAEAGKVTLVGIVVSEAQRERAASLVAAVDGVRAVINELELHASA